MKKTKVSFLKKKNYETDEVLNVVLGVTIGTNGDAPFTATDDLKRKRKN